jgi:hypothetical protein
VMHKRVSVATAAAGRVMAFEGQGMAMTVSR